MGIVDDDKVPRLVKTRAPQFARPMLKRVCGKALPCTRYFGYFREEFVRDRDQGFGCAFDLALPDADTQMCESRVRQELGILRFRNWHRIVGLGLLQSSSRRSNFLQPVSVPGRGQLHGNSWTLQPELYLTPGRSLL